MPAPDFVPYSDAQIGEQPRLRVGHHAAVDLDDDEGATLAIVSGAYDYDGETGMTVTLGITTGFCDRLVVELHDGTIYDGPPETDGLSAAALAGALRAAMKNADGSRSTLSPTTLEQMLTTLGL
jgi:hypothetical protein